MLADLGEAKQLFTSTRRATMHAQTQGVGALRLCSRATVPAT